MKCKHVEELRRLRSEVEALRIERNGLLASCAEKDEWIDEAVELLQKLSYRYSNDSICGDGYLLISSACGLERAPSASLAELKAKTIEEAIKGYGEVSKNIGDKEMTFMEYLYLRIYNLRRQIGE